MNLNKKNDFAGVDFTKFIMAIFVVAIHTHPFKGIDSNLFVNIWNVIITFAVPYFFIASGFFLFLKVNKETDKSLQLVKIKTYGKRIIKLYIYWNILYLPITIWNIANNDLVFYKDIL